MKFLKKNIIIDAIQWDGSRIFDVVNFLGDDYLIERLNNEAKSIMIEYINFSSWIVARNKNYIAHKNDFIIKDSDGFLRILSPDLFLMDYSPLTDSKLNESSCSFEKWWNAQGACSDALNSISKEDISRSAWYAALRTVKGGYK